MSPQAPPVPPAPPCPPVPPPPSKLDYFKIFREYRVAEHTLLNHRLTWNLTLQGLLFATYGLGLQKLAQSPDDGTTDKIAADAMSHLQSLINNLPLVGLSLSVCILIAAVGAYFSLRKLDHDWLANHEKTPPADIPNPNGGGSRVAFWLAFGPAVVIPAIFTYIWGWIIHLAH